MWVVVPPRQMPHDDGQGTREAGNAICTRLVWTLTAAALVQAVQMPFFWPARASVSHSFFIGHLAVVFLVQLGLALLLGGRDQRRAWATAVFLLPLAAVLCSPKLFWIAMPARLVFGSAGLVAVAAAWRAWGSRTDHGSPLLAALLGTVLGAETLRVRWDSVEAGRMQPGAAVLYLLATAAIAVGFLLSERLSIRLERLPARVALPVTAGALAAAAALNAYAARWPAPLDIRGKGGAPVVLVVLDTLRADHLRLYGYDRDTMPRLERTVRAGWLRAERCLAPHPSSLPSHASIFTGLHPPHHGAHRPLPDDPRRNAVKLYSLRPDVPTLAGLLAGAGYWTVGLAANFGHLDPHFGLGRGFALYRAVPEQFQRRTPWWGPLVLSESVRQTLATLWPFAASDLFSLDPFRSATTITNEALSAVDAAGDRSFFLFLNYMDAHAPYAPPYVFRDAFPGRNPALGLGDAAETRTKELTKNARRIAVADRAHLTALYDGELAYIDSELDRLLQRLRQHPRWAEMLVIVTSDHGEAFGERRFIGHDRDLHEEALVVPLFVKPGLHGVGTPPGPLLPGLVQSEDIFPLVLEHAGIPVPAGIDGRSWGSGRDVARSWHYSNEGEWRAVEQSGWKLIDYGNGRRELYDHLSDPGETRDLAKQEKARRDALAALLGPRAGTAPVEADSTPSELEERLGALGYVQ